MKIIRYYLTSNEMIEIVDTLITKESAIERNIILYGMVAQCVCDIDIKYENCNDLYDEILKQGLYTEIQKIDNFKDIKEIVNEQLGVDSTVRMFVKELGNKLGDLDLNNLVQSLESVKEVVK